MNGNNYNYGIDIIDVLSKNPSLKRNLYKIIYQNFKKGTNDGVFKIKQNSILSAMYSDKSNIVTSHTERWNMYDYSWGYGTMDIIWETNGAQVILYVNDLYAFYLDKNSANRASNKIYKIVARKVLNGDYDGNFYITSKKEIPLDLIRIEGNQ